MSLGPLMLNVDGLELDLEDREILTHPVVGGVILFARNYDTPAQLQALVDSIHQLREPRLLVAVDQEGGRVQRFCEGFTRLPPAASIGDLYSSERDHALQLAYQLGWCLAAELRSFGIDLSFTPVLDLHKRRTGVIGDRAFHAEPAAVAELARAELRGLAAGGMVGIGKHFPGHGSVRGDSHHMMPVDSRDIETLAQTDMAVFERMIHYGLAGIMSSHVLYPAVDDQVVSCSTRWLRDVLRGRLEFNGAIFSDDLSMQGAQSAGDVVARSQAALDAGTDMILVCNDRGAAASVVENLRCTPEPAAGARLARMRGVGGIEREKLHADPDFITARTALEAMTQQQ